MNRYYLAVDIGASSGRHILGWMEEGQLKTEEIYRFHNTLTKKNGHLCWNYEQLFYEIITGMKRCGEIGKYPVSMGIDTWGVDFILLDHENRVLGDTIGYRDRRTEGMDAKVSEIIPERELYGRTGIQKAIFNSIYQLYAVKEEDPMYLKEASAFLMVPEYFNFLLTGKKKAEYTNATTTQLINAVSKDWDTELIEKLGFPREIFLPLCLPGTEVGKLKHELVKELGYDLTVVLVGSHDTASAVVSVPATGEEALYVSSGTWSLMGVERKEPDLSQESQQHNFTNEGGYDYRYRYLKNIMGLWMIQSVRQELENQYTFAELCELAEENKDYTGRVDVNDETFLAPDNMIEAIKAYLSLHGQPLPKSIGQLAACIYESLAEYYSKTVKELEEITGKVYTDIHIVGGGSNAEYLNRLTADKTLKTVYAGPVEATAIGNIAVQMIYAGDFTDLNSVRSCIFDSFEIKQYTFH